MERDCSVSPCCILTNRRTKRLTFCYKVIDIAAQSFGDATALGFVAKAGIESIRSCHKCYALSACEAGGLNGTCATREMEGLVMPISVRVIE